MIDTTGLNNSFCAMNMSLVALTISRLIADLPLMARLLVNLCQQRGAGNRPVRRRFDHDGIAHSHRRSDRAVAQVKRKVPRADHTNHADRLAVNAALLGVECPARSGLQLSLGR